ncbi:MAG: ABC transporter substrate-binding protein [Bacilli bacterium]|nr:ABC transporter substrate-binding protein [Bacilli bacterium]
MKKTKLALLTLPLILLSITGCDRARWHIGICQLIRHAALDAATQGFMDAVKEELGAANVKFDLQNAAGDSGTCVTISNSFVSKNKDLIMANATPALQAAANTTKSIPILGTSITEYGVALGINDFSGTVGGNISGTSDLAPLSEQAQMVVDVFPTATKVGLLYCSAEANSLYQVQVVEQELQAKGLSTTRMSFADSNDISQVLNGSISDIDVLYIPTDNTAASCTSTINSICSSHNIPVVAGEEGLCKGCGAVTLSISYYNLGVKTGQMAVEILRDGKDISTMPIAYDENPVKKYNPQICEQLGITVPDGYVPIEL